MKGKFTRTSDVFSFGVLMWELLTNGDVPWGMGAPYDVVHKRVTTGERLELPDDTRPDLRALIAECWDPKPVKRPTFEAISARLTDIKACTMAPLQHTQIYICFMYITILFDTLQNPFNVVIPVHLFLFSM
jgi:hypothetical protein